MPSIFLYDDARARAFEPFALTRPAASLTAGMAPIWSRWQTALQGQVAGLIGGPHLEGFDDGVFRDFDTAPHMATGVIPKGTMIGNSRFAPVLSLLPADDPQRSPDLSAHIWRSGDRIAAVRVSREVRVSEIRDGALDLEGLAPGGAAEATMEGWWLDDVWDLVRWLPDMLATDLRTFALGPFERSWSPKHFGPPPAHTTVIGGQAVLVGAGVFSDGAPVVPAAIIEPHVVLDATAGPIVIMHGAHVHAFTRLNGPCFIGHGTTVMGGELSTCSIGPVCKVRGEMSNTIMCGYANKGHDGFVGHSYLGRWTNLGAGTITSNLKNTYGSVAMWTPGGMRDTGMQFLGTLFGDHAKTGIGIRLTTGTVLGAGANVYGSAMPPKCVPPFAWGEKPPYATYRLEKFMEVAERVMARRKQSMSDDCRRQLATAYAARWTVEIEKAS